VSSPGTCDIVLVSKKKEKQERDHFLFVTLIFTKESILNQMKEKGRGKIFSRLCNKHTHVVCYDPCLEYHFGG
jgi:hypothetical protein